MAEEKEKPNEEKKESERGIIDTEVSGEMSS